jgi:hypothetical protein
MSENNMTFIEFIQTFRRGELLRQIERDMSDVLQGVRDTGSGGALAINLPFKVNKAGQLECNPKVSPKIPETPIGTGIYYLTEDASLSRRDPNQGDWVDEIENRRSGNS